MSEVMATTSVGIDPVAAPTTEKVPIAMVVASSAPENRSTGPTALPGTRVVRIAPTTTNATRMAVNMPVHRRSASDDG